MQQFYVFIFRAEEEEKQHGVEPRRETGLHFLPLSLHLAPVSYTHLTLPTILLV